VIDIAVIPVIDHASFASSFRCRTERLAIDAADNRLDLSDGSSPRIIYTSGTLASDVSAVPICEIARHVRIFWGLPSSDLDEWNGVASFQAANIFYCQTAYSAFSRFAFSPSTMICTLAITGEKGRTRTHARAQSGGDREASWLETETDRRESATPRAVRRQSRKTRIKGDFHLGILKILICFK